MDKLALIFRISWRSIWRNRRRTWITLSAIAFGLALAVFFIAFADGVYNQLIDDATRMQGGHFTLEHPQYREAPAVDLFVGGVSGLRARLEALDGVGGTKALVLGQGVARSARGAAGVSVMGVEPSLEAAASPIAASMAAGSYLEEGDGRKVVVGTGLAKRLEVRTGRKLVLATNDASGEIVEELFRVKGTFEVGSDEVDAYLVQIPLEFARRLYGLGVDDATQVGVLLADAGRRPAVMAAAREFVPAEVALRTWEEVMPDLANYIRVDRGGNLVFQGIVVFLSLFTIFNTILMSVLERTRELAMQLALGVSASLLRLQVVIESALLGALGSTLGVLLGGGLGYWMQAEGLDISRFYGDDLDVSGFALDTMVYADVTVELLVSMWLLVFAATVLLSLIPGRQISRIAVADVLRA